MATDVTEDPTMVKMAHGSFAWLAHFLCLDGSECMMDGLTRVWENVDLDICYLHAAFISERSTFPRRRSFSSTLSGKQTNGGRYVNTVIYLLLLG